MVVTNDKDSNTKIIDLVQHENPKAQIYARSYDRLHSIELYKKDINFSVRETFESALTLSQKALEGVGVSHEDAKMLIADIRIRDLNRLKEQAKGDIYLGQQHLLNQPIKPEPLQ
jgi:CPA2 family monovalent cation:H+ antiporter-2